MHTPKPFQTGRESDKLETCKIKKIRAGTHSIQLVAKATFVSYFLLTPNERKFRHRREATKFKSPIAAAMIPASGPSADMRIARLLGTVTPRWRNDLRRSSTETGHVKTAFETRQILLNGKQQRGNDSTIAVTMMVEFFVRIGWDISIPRRPQWIPMHDKFGEYERNS